MGLADITAMREQAVEARLDGGALSRLTETLDALGKAAHDAVLAQGVMTDRIALIRRAQLKYEGTDTTLTVPFGYVDAMKLAFEAAYRERYSFLMPERALVVEAVAVEAVGSMTATAQQCAFVVDTQAPPSQSGEGAPSTVAPDTQVSMYSDGSYKPTPLHRRENLKPGHTITGPAIIAEANATTVIEPGWQATVTQNDHLVLTRATPRHARTAIGTTVDPVMLEIFNNLFMAIAEQMGVTLANTAYSVNIKERLDFSCALFNAEGDLIANAPHMPVHLGSMGESVRSVIRDNAGQLRAGDVLMLNDPYRGGTHLPDITVITPVFDAKGENIVFYVGSRGHHADVGGITACSSPTFCWSRAGAFERPKLVPCSRAHATPRATSNKTSLICAL
jgi:5-oxoprolinase (ATP-hydrolysing)